MEILVPRSSSPERAQDRTFKLDWFPLEKAVVVLTSLAFTPVSRPMGTLFSMDYVRLAQKLPTSASLRRFLHQQPRSPFWFPHRRKFLFPHRRAKWVVA